MDKANKGFYTTLDRADSQVPNEEDIYVKIDANARTGKRGDGGTSEDSKMLGAYECGALNNNGEKLVTFAK